MDERSPVFSQSIYFLSLKFCIFAVFFYSTSVVTANDAAVLKELSKSLTPTPSGWSGPDPCTWSGIICDISLRVTSIDLSAKSLSGSLPPDLNKLTHLKTLNLQQNQFSGPLPSFSHLSYLQELILDSNNFSSVPPSIFSGLTNLQTLTLSENVNLEPWSLPQELIQSKTLVALYASNANLIGSIPNSFDSFSKLQNLRLSYNNLTGPLPNSLAGSQIRNLWLNNQNLGLSGTIEGLRTMTKLSQVWLHRNMFTGPIPDLSNCKSLFDLQLRDNRLTGVVPPSLTMLSQLVNVSLASNMLQGPYPSFRNGFSVAIGTTNNFCDTKPGPCAPQVTTLLNVARDLGFPISLAESWIGNNPCQDWAFIICDSEGENVTEINFAKQQFVGRISPAIADLGSLRNLFLNDNNLTGSIPDRLTGLTQLRSLDVSNNNLSGKIPDFISKVTLKSAGNPLLVTITITPTDALTPGDGGSGAGAGLGPSASVSTGKRSTLRSNLIIIILVITLGTCTLCILGYFWFKRKGNQTGTLRKLQGLNRVFALVNSKDSYKDSPNENMFKDGVNESETPELQLFDFASIAIATNNFCLKNKLGEGGFGPVYKGKLPNGQEMAVKRLCRSSGQGIEEFKNELLLISKLQHRNLVKLLGCCAEGEENMLLYEYMPNKSLDAFLFESRNRAQLDWRKRFNIIEGIARGLLYLYRDSRLRVIHRDLKMSNILLDEDMNPKISDFGMARIFGGKQTIANTNRVVGTFGYMSPEYIMGGTFSEKSDVFSFGVLILEIVSSKRNNNFYHPEQPLSLLVHAWRLWNEDKWPKIVDEALADSYSPLEVKRCIHVGLLCVQKRAEDRPTMSTVDLMLSSETNLPHPNEPPFTSETSFESNLQQLPCTNNYVTITTVEGR